MGMELTELPESLGQLTRLQTLDLTDNQLTSLPEWLGQLTGLKKLALHNNQLTALPEWLGQLTQLQVLELSSNELTRLPESLGQLKKLRSLHVSDNHLTAIPETINGLVRLERLWIGRQCYSDLIHNGVTVSYYDRTEYGNPLASMPEHVTGLRRLRELAIGKCQLKRVPPWVGELPELVDLDIRYNKIADLQPTIGKLAHLRKLNLEGNPLNPELAVAYEQGLDAVKAYLRERAKGTRRRFEAKLLILGDGNEGKTCVSRALRGLSFEKQATTRGVDVEPWPFPHPDHSDDEDFKITLNLWDFEGQEINHHTHQFFLSTDSLYVLVFKCRDQFLLDRAEYWLDTIRSRAPEAHVAIVITECEHRTPYVPQDRLLAEYGDLLRGDRWLFAVGCADKSGVPDLQKELQRRAADLEFMGRPWPKTYDKAENQIEAQAKTISHITRSELYQIFEGSEIDAAGYNEAARALARLGIITEFPDCPDLNDFIVLQPQWLTKAISYVMEDTQLNTDQGEITFARMQEIWGGHEQRAMFPIFHNCMKEFELCYDLEDYNDRCLVPLRFGYLKPEIPWSAKGSFRTRRVTYRLNLHPPVGLMSRFIVKTHHMIVHREAEEGSSDGRRGVYWHNGVFLQSGEGPLLSQALCQFHAESRTLSIEVRAAFPQKMLDRIDAYVRAVFAFFQGLKPARSYGCIRVDESSQAETQCDAVHSERKILFAIQNEEMLGCEDGWHKVDPMRLITGIGSFGGDIETVIRKEAERTRERMEKTPRWAKPFIHNINVLLNWADQHQQILEQLQDDHVNLLPEIRQELELKLREYLGHMSDMLDERHQKSAPSVFSIGTQDGSPWNPKTYFKETYVLTPWCECEGQMHRHDAGHVLFSTNRDWWDKTVPWIARGTKVLATGLQLAFAGLPLALGNNVYNVIKNDVTFMKEMTKHLELALHSDSEYDKEFLCSDDAQAGEHIKDVRGDDKETPLIRAALTRFLEELAPNNYRAGQWGELKRVRLPDNSYRWLCEACAKRVRK